MSAMDSGMSGSALDSAIERMGSQAVAIANRWTQGWPDQVQALLESGSYLVNLAAQAQQEQDILAQGGPLSQIRQSPPTETVVMDGEATFVEGDAVSPLPAFIHRLEPPTPEQEARTLALRLQQQAWARIETGMPDQEAS